MIRVISIFGVSFAVVAAFVLAGLPDGDSGSLNYSWSINYTETAGLNSLLPRFLPDLWAGLGGYDFFFYAPLPFWFNAFFIAPFCSGCDPMTPFLIGGGLFLIVGSFTFYLFVRQFFEPRAALTGAIIYALLPYHLWMDWFTRQAVGEYAAYVFIPLIALGLDIIRKGGKHGWVLTIGVAGVALCHLPTTLLAAHVFGVMLIVFMFVGDQSKFTIFLRALLWSVVGILIAAFYWLPAVVLLPTVSAEYLYTDYLVAAKWLYSLQFDQPSPRFAADVLMSFFAVLPVIISAATETKGVIRTWIVVPVLFVVFMNLQISAPIWENWIIDRVQFPWRMMVFVDLCAGIAAAVFAARIMSNKKRGALIIMAPLMLVPSIYFVSQLPKVKEIPNLNTEYSKYFGAFEYLSADMLTVLREARGAGRISLDNADTFMSDLKKIAADHAKQMTASPRVVSPRRMIVQPPSGSEKLLLPIQYWFLWQAHTSDGTPLQTVPNLDFGTVDVLSDEGGFDGEPVIVTLPYHWSEKLGFLLSLIALLFMAGVVFRNFSLKR